MKTIYIHSRYPDGAHAVDCEGCRGTVAAILREWIYDRSHNELPDTPGEVADRILTALANG
jgi:hypothetical protein